MTGDHKVGVVALIAGLIVVVVLLVGAFRQAKISSDNGQRSKIEYIKACKTLPTSERVICLDRTP